MITVLVFCSTMATMNGGLPGRAVEVQGHRGARALRPENTLAAFRHALEAGVDVIELDLVVTRDDHLVVAHDLFVNPEICLGPGGARVPPRLAVRSLSLAELRTYDCGSLRHPRFPDQQPVPGERIPTLEEVFELLEADPSHGHVRLNLEAKSLPSRPDLSLPPEAWAAALDEALKAPSRRSRSGVQSFDHRILRSLHHRAPDLPISPLVSEDLPDLVELARDLGAGTVSPHQDWITSRDVAALHAAGVRVVVWTANTPEEWARLVDMGVDGIITDNPAGLLAWMGRQRAVPSR